MQNSNPKNEDLFAQFRELPLNSDPFEITPIEKKKSPHAEDDKKIKEFIENREEEDDEEEEEEIKPELPLDPKKIEENDEEEETNPFHIFAKSLHEKGIFSELPEDMNPEDMDEDFLESLVKSEIDKGIDSYKNTLSHEAKAALEYLDTYGTLNGFADVYQEIDYSKIDPDKLQEAEDSDLEWIVAQKLRSVDNESEETIKEIIEDYKETGLLKKQAKMSLDKLTRYQEKRRKDLETKVETEKADRKAKDKDEYEKTKAMIMDSKSIAGFTPSKKVREEFFSYLTKPVGKNKETQMEITYKNKENQIKMAW